MTFSLAFSCQGLDFRMVDSYPAIKIRALLPIAPYLARRGISTIEFCRRLGISPNMFQNADGWLLRAQCFQMANVISSFTADPFAGAHVGFSTDLQELGVWGESILTANDVADACTIAVANTQMIHRGSDIRFLVEGRTARIIFRFADRCDSDPRHFIFGSLAVLRKVPLLAGEPSGIKVRLSAPMARGTDALEQCLGPNIEMGGEYDMVEFDRDLLDMPLRMQGEQPTRITRAQRSTVAAARLLSERLSDFDRLGLETVAARMGVSVRTLQRRLKDCGVDFEELLDETRRSEAIRMICEGDHSMTEIAYRLGYSDPAHFTRAFRRWTGTAPSRFQKDSP